jgi:site-specific recombinase
MVTKRSKEIVDNLLESLYDDNITSVCPYENDIIEIMIDLKCTLSDALDVDFNMNGVDTDSVIGIVDYLEYRLRGDLDKVNLLMKVYTRQTPDFGLVKL